MVVNAEKSKHKSIECFKSYYSRESENLLSHDVAIALASLRDMWFPSKDTEEVKPVNLVLAKLARFILPVRHPAGFKHSLEEEIRKTAKRISSTPEGEEGNVELIKGHIQTLFNNRQQLQRILHLTNLKSLKLDDSYAGTGYAPQLYPDVDMLFPDNSDDKERTIEEYIEEIRKRALPTKETKKAIKKIRVQDNVDDPEKFRRRKLLMKRYKMYVPVDVDTSKKDIYQFAREEHAFYVVKGAVREILSQMRAVMDKIVQEGGEKEELRQQQYYFNKYIIDKLMPREDATWNDLRATELSRICNTLWLFDTFGLGEAELLSGQGLTKADVRFKYSVKFDEMFDKIVSAHINAFFNVDTDDPKYKYGARNMDGKLITELKKLDAYPDEDSYNSYKRVGKAKIRTLPGAMQGKIPGALKTLQGAFKELSESEKKRIQEYFASELNNLGEDQFWDIFTGKYLSHGIARSFSIDDPQPSLIKFIETKPNIRKETRQKALNVVDEYNEVFGKVRDVVYKKWSKAERFTFESRNKQANVKYEEQLKALRDYVQSAKEARNEVKSKRAKLAEQINALSDKTTFLARVYKVILRAYDELLREDSVDPHAVTSASWNENIERAQRAMNAIELRVLVRGLNIDFSSSNEHVKERFVVQLTQQMVQKLKYLHDRIRTEFTEDKQDGITGDVTPLKDDVYVWDQVVVLLGAFIAYSETVNKPIPDTLVNLSRLLTFLYDAHCSGGLYDKKKDEDTIEVWKGILREIDHFVSSVRIQDSRPKSRKVRRSPLGRPRKGKHNSRARKTNKSPN